MVHWLKAGRRFCEKWGVIVVIRGRGLHVVRG